jgi:cytoskeletal protein CcmA (bactofilin family)
MFQKKPSAPAPQSRTAAQSALFERMTPSQPAPKQASTHANPIPVKPVVQQPTASPRPTQASASSEPSSPEKDETMNQPSKPAAAPAPTFRSDFRNEARNEPAARRVDLSGTPSARGNPETEATRKLVVGREISLNGEISTCDYLVVEGTVEARVREGRRIEIAETGLFKGTVEIDEADIAGRFEGDIVARGRLRVRATGSITGKVQYGELEIEAGGRIDGTLASLKPGKPEAKTVQARTTSVDQLKADLATETA